MRRVALLLVLCAAVAACGPDRDDAVQPTASAATTTAAVSTTAATTTEPSVTTALAPEPEIVIPSGVLAAMPFQNRLDVPLNIFQVKLYNGTAESLPIVGVQLVWDGLTTPVSDRANTLAAGDRLDYPVPLAAAHCAGDGTVAEMPDVSKAVVRVLLADGSERFAPVYDVKHFARRLYLEDCERQRIDAAVQWEWADLHEVTLDGRPVTAGTLRLTRKAGDGTITVDLVTGTIIFVFNAPDADDVPVAVLPAGQQSVEVPILFTEGRCDVHAMSEVSQPFGFNAVIDLGDGLKRPYKVPPPESEWATMRHRLETACAILGKVGFVGQDDLTSGGSTTTTA